jgi:4-carboxymuconolactone decarboxylase
MTPRIPPPKPDELRADAAELLPLTAPPGREPPGTMSVLARQPDLLAPFLGWAAALALNGALPKRDHEVVALRAAWNCRSAFQWGEHAAFARAAGLDDDAIARVAQSPDAPGWQPHEAALLRAADELHRDATVTDATWAILAGHYATAQLVEVLFVAGQYTMLSMVANAAGVEPEPGLDPLPTAGAAYGWPSR